MIASHDCIPRTHPMSASHDRIPRTFWPRRPVIPIVSHEPSGHERPSQLGRAPDSLVCRYYHMNHWPREAVPPGQSARSPFLRRYLVAPEQRPGSPDPFGHERPSLLGRATVPHVRRYLVAPELRSGSPVPVSCFPRRPRLRLVDFGVRSAPTCVLRFWIGGEVAAMCRSGIGWTWLTGTKRCDRTWPSGTKRCELAVEVEAGSCYHYIPPHGRLYLALSVRAGGAASREANRTFTR
jgi:hypothetical protein